MITPEDIKTFYNKGFRDECLKRGVLLEKNGKFYLKSTREEIPWKLDEDIISKSS